jgi:ABC-2 type transport system permease protein
MIPVLRAALQVEALLLRRSAVLRIAVPVLVVLVPCGSFGAVALSRSDYGVGAAAVKLAPYAAGDPGTTVMVVLAQILSVAMLAAGGFTTAWAFGQPFTDGTAGASFGLTVPRTTIALARCLVILASLATTVLAATLVGLALAALAGATLATVSPSTPPGLGQATVTALIAGMLGIGLALPFAWVATATRSAFGTVGVLIAVIAATQVIVLLGAGSWFPYAASSLWTGMGGPEAAAAVGTPQLALTAAVGPIAVVAVVHAWRRLTDV